MIPVLLPVGAMTPSGGSFASSTVWTARPLDAGAAAADDAEAIASWASEDGSLTLAQATSGQRPVADDDLYPGVWSVLFANDDNLAVTPGADVAWVLLIVRPVSGSRTLASRDTSATTTKPAFQVRIEDV